MAKVFLEHDAKPDPPVVSVAEVEPMSGFTRVFDNINGSAQPKVVERYLLKLSPDGQHYDLATRCSLSSTFHGCQIYFSPQCNPAIDLHVTGWPYERIDEAFEVRRAVDAFISAHIKSPKCG